MTTRFDGTAGDDVLPPPLSPGSPEYLDDWEVSGFGGNDTLRDNANSFPTNDVLYGDDGDDVLIHDRGNDSLFGGAGADEIIINPRTAKLFVDGGEGRDTLFIRLTSSFSGNNADPFIASLSAQILTDRPSATGPLVNSYVVDLIGMENFEATFGTWHVFGDSKGNVLTTGIFDDLLAGNGGADLLRGRPGDDTLLGGDQNDTLEGGTGIDSLRGGAGDDVLYAHAPDDPDLSGPENFEDDTLSGGPGADWLFDSAGETLLEGGSGGDQIFSGAGRDTIDAGPGDDFIFMNGHTYEDLTRPDITPAKNHHTNASMKDLEIDGGPGRDTLILDLVETRNVTVAAPSQENLAMGLRIDLAKETGVDLPNRGTVLAGTFTVINIENVRGTAFDDILIGSGKDNDLAGGSGDDLIAGGLGRDSLFGGNGADEIWGDLRDEGVTISGGTNDNDWIYGQSGPDTIFGGGGNDRLSGGADADRIEGGPGNDRLKGGPGTDVLFGGPGQNAYKGGSGADTFVIIPGNGFAEDNQHRIRDFDPTGRGHDLLDLQAFDVEFRDLTFRQMEGKTVLRIKIAEGPAGDTEWQGKIILRDVLATQIDPEDLLL